MATAKKSTRRKSVKTGAKSTTRKPAGTKSRQRSTAAHSRKSAPGRSAAKKGSAKKTSASVRSRGTAARKTGSRTAHGQAWTDAHSKNPSSTGRGKAKKEPAKQDTQCWPGYEPVPGKARGTKGSCKPKAHQTSAEKKSDAMAAAGSKLRKAGGSKAQANRSR